MLKRKILLPGLFMAGLVLACPVSEAGGLPGRASGQTSGRTLGRTTGKQEPEKYVPGALYVKFADHAVSYVKSAERECPVSALSPAKSARSRYGLKPVAYSMHLLRASTLDNVFRIEFDSVRKTAEFIEALRNDPRVVFVEQVPLQTIQVEPTGQDGKKPGDYFFGNIDSIHTSWNLEMVGYSEIYGRYQGKSEVKAAVVDNAVWGDHEDLQLLYDNLYDTFLGVSGSASPPAGCCRACMWAGLRKQARCKRSSSHVSLGGRPGLFHGLNLEQLGAAALQKRFFRKWFRVERTGKRKERGGDGIGPEGGKRKMERLREESNKPWEESDNRKGKRKEERSFLVLVGFQARRRNLARFFFRAVPLSRSSARGTAVSREDCSMEKKARTF